MQSKSGCPGASYGHAGLQEEGDEEEEERDKEREDGLAWTAHQVGEG